MALFNPDSRKGLSGMISGFVDRQWAKRHYRRWYREHHEHEERQADSHPPAEPAPQDCAGD